MEGQVPVEQITTHLRRRRKGGGGGGGGGGRWRGEGGGGGGGIRLASYLEAILAFYQGFPTLSLHCCTEITPRCKSCSHGDTTLFHGWEIKSGRGRPSYTTTVQQHSKSLFSLILRLSPTLASGKLQTYMYVYSIQSNGYNHSHSDLVQYYTRASCTTMYSATADLQCISRVGGGQEEVLRLIEPLQEQGYVTS